VVKCPYCGYEGEFRLLKTWKFRFYDIKMLECTSCKCVFNHYYGVSSTGKRSEFMINPKNEEAIKSYVLNPLR